MNDSSTSELAKNNNRNRFKKSAIIHIISFSLGLLSGIALALHQKGTISLSDNTLIIGTVLLIACALVLTWVWFKSMDEFEKIIFHEAGSLAFNSSILALPWIILNELGILPSLDAIVLLFIMVLVFIIYYYGKKFL